MQGGCIVRRPFLHKGVLIAMQKDGRGSFDPSRTIAPERRSTDERIVARSFYRELRENGYSPQELLGVSTELIGLVTRDLATKE